MGFGKGWRIIQVCAGVAEWQTRWTQNPLSERVCGFDSLLRQCEEGMRATGFCAFFRFCLGFFRDHAGAWSVVFLAEFLVAGVFEVVDGFQFFFRLDEILFEECLFEINSGAEDVHHEGSVGGDGFFFFFGGEFVEAGRRERFGDEDVQLEFLDQFERGVAIGFILDLFFEGFVDFFHGFHVAFKGAIRAEGGDGEEEDGEEEGADC